MAQCVHQALWMCEISGEFYSVLTLFRRSVWISEIPESMRAECPARHGGIVPSIRVCEIAIQRGIIERNSLRCV